MRLLVFCMSFYLLTGCQVDVDKNDYFPMNEGLIWHYQVTEELTEKKLEREFSIRNLGTIQLEGDYSDLPVFRRRTSDGTDYYIVQDDAGTERIALRTLVETAPRFDVEPRKILPAARDIEVGRSWTTETRVYAIHSPPAYSLAAPEEKTLSMNFEVTSVDDEVSVLAGDFSRCIRVEGIATLTLYADARLGYVDVPVTQTEWYAPGVGLVKLVREEPLDVEMFKGGKVSFELMGFEK